VGVGAPEHTARAHGRNGGPACVSLTLGSTLGRSKAPPGRVRRMADTSSVEPHTRRLATAKPRPAPRRAMATIRPARASNNPSTANATPNRGEPRNRATGRAATPRRKATTVQRLGQGRAGAGAGSEAGGAGAGGGAAVAGGEGMMMSWPQPGHRVLLPAWRSCAEDRRRQCGQSNLITGRLPLWWRSQTVPCPSGVRVVALALPRRPLKAAARWDEEFGKVHCRTAALRVKAPQPGHAPVADVPAVMDARRRAS
jgi:hypothetical protein